MQISDMHKHKAKIAGLQELIGQMHHMMLGGQGDKSMKVEDAVKQAEEEMTESPSEKSMEAKMSPDELSKYEANEPAEVESQTAEPHGLEEYIRSEMKKGSSMPVKGKAMVIAAKMSKPAPSFGKKKY